MIARIFPADKPLHGTVDPPSSKNYTTRYILVGCLTEGESIVERPAVQDDAVALVRCARQFGARIVAKDHAGSEVEFSVANALKIDRLHIRGFGAHPQTPKEPVDPANAGTVLRLLLGTAALADGPVRFETAQHKDSLGKRPNHDLIAALRLLGVGVEARGDEGALPITIMGGLARIRAALAERRKALGIPQGEAIPIPVSGAVSSQFVSSLLFLAPLIGEPLAIRVTGEVRSGPLIDTTLAVLKESGVVITVGGVHVDAAHPDLIVHAGEGGYGTHRRQWAANGDWPGSSAILAAAAVVPHSEITVRRLFRDEQGEKLCLAHYEALGCRSAWLPGIEGGVHFKSPAHLVPRGGRAETNGDQCTDAVLAMLGASACATDECVFTGINNLQFKECDRVREPIAELRKIAKRDTVAAWEPDANPDTIRVLGSQEPFHGGIEVDGRKDHRVIMMLSIVGLRCRDGLTIKGAEHVAKSFPRWFETLKQMGARVELA